MVLQSWVAQFRINRTVIFFLKKVQIGHKRGVMLSDLIPDFTDGFLPERAGQKSFGFFPLYI